jgi:transposase
MESDAAINSLVARSTRVLQDPVGENVSIFRRLSQASFVGIQTMKKNKGAKAKTKSEVTATKPLHEPNPDACGIDLSPTEIWVAVPPERAQNSVRKFEAFTKDLIELVQWLVQCGVHTVAMEATGVYWIPLYQLLEDAKIKVCLVNAQHVKNVPGRKSDVRDCQWLQYLLSVGLLLGSFRPAQAVCAVRSIWRYRQELISRAGQYIQHMQAALDQMNIKLHYVIDDLTGLTGQAIIEAILKGQRDPVQLAKLRDKRIQAPESIIAKALEGDWRKEHLFVLQKAWEGHQHIQQQIQQCDQELQAYARELEAATQVIQPTKTMRLKPELVGAEPVSNPRGQKASKVRKKTSKNQPEGPWKEELERFFRVDLTAIPGISVLTALTLMTELGNDLRAFKTEHHFASWLCLCPGNETSAGKVLRRRTRRSHNRVRHALRMAASSLHHDKSYLGEKYRRLRTRLGAPKAIVAMAHQLARIIWILLTRQVPFDLSVFAHQEKLNEQRRLQRLQASARQMGYQLTPIAA